MIPTREWIEFLAKGEDIQAIVVAGEQRAEEEVRDAYITLATLSREAAELGQRLHRERAVALAAPVTLAAAVIHQQIELAAGRPWYPRRRERVRGNDRLGPAGLSAGVAAGLLAAELNTLALVLLTAADDIPEPLAPGVRRCVGRLVQVAAQIDGALLG